MTVRKVLIVSTRESLQEGLRALLASLPEIKTLEPAQSLERTRHTIINKRPDLVVLDVEGLGDQALEVLEMLRIDHPSTKSLVLVENMRQQTQVQVAGADVALIKGYPANELIETAKALLAPRNTRAEKGEQR
jgi:DNA-binding NarL/FixJ family response regulator